MHGQGPTQGWHARSWLVERRRALPRVERRACGAGRGCGSADGGRRRPACSGGSAADWGQNRRGAHPEHLVHVRHAGGVPIGNVRVEVLQVREEPAHVGDGRDVPIGDGAVRLNSGIRGSVVGLGRRLQLVLARKDVIEQAAAAACGRQRRGRRRGRRRQRRRRSGQAVITLTIVCVTILGNCAAALNGDRS
eukprot:scaffold18453_cov65-Phaeocystis_antarctica.AAC.4